MGVTIKRVLAATDFSPAGQRAVDAAAHWARQARAQLRIVHVAPPQGWLGGLWGVDSAAGETIDRHAANALKEVAAHADPQRTIELSTGVLHGAAAKSIARAARDYEADLIVVGARGERDASGEGDLGGTSTKLLASAPAPLLLVRRARATLAAGVIAAVDLSPRSSAVLEWGHLAAAESHLYVYHVYDIPFAARLEAFYRKTRPPGFWGPVRAACPDLPPAAPVRPVLGLWAAGLALVLGLVAGTGKLLLGEPGVGALFLATAGVGGGWIYRSLRPRA